MNKEQIQKELEEMDEYLPVSEIERRLKMPQTTLQKVLKGGRELPRKWVKVLRDYFLINTEKKREHKSIGSELKEDISKNDTQDRITDVFAKIKAIRDEKMPEHITKGYAIKVWQNEQNGRIKELEREL